MTFSREFRAIGRLTITYGCLALFVTRGCAQASAEEAPAFASPPVNAATLPPGSSQFVSPNEAFPGLALPLYRSVPAGALVAVGSERAFIAAALASRTTRHYFIDSDPGVVLFNQINVALLSIARDREHYVHLRLQAGAREWNAALRNAGYPAFCTLAAFRWWKEKVRDSASHGFQEIHAVPPAPRADGVPHPFANANYLYEDALFSRLQRLAKNGSIVVSQRDLNNASDVEALWRDLRANRVKLSLLDISNAVDGYYMTDASLAALTHGAARERAKGGWLVFTGAGRFLKTGMSWTYYGLDLDRVEHQGDAASFAQQVREGQKTIRYRRHDTYLVGRRNGAFDFETPFLPNAVRETDDPVSNLTSLCGGG